MPGAQVSRCACALPALWGLAALLAAEPAGAGDAAPALPPSRAAVPSYDFDIPALPLVQALDRYAVLTQRPALFSSELAAGRTSSPVRGRHTPEAALQRMLKGTGLVAEVAGAGPADAFVLRAARAGERPMPAALALAGDYPGLVQARLWGALCGNAATRPGAYRALLRFEVDRRGAVQRVRLLGSTGDAGRDEAVRSTLERVRLAPPPAAMPQPLTMIVLPDARGGGGASPRCASPAS